MRSWGICAIAVVLLSMGGCGGTSANDVNGLVIDDLGNPIDGVMVRVDGALVKTSDGGKFSIRAVAGMYTATTAIFVGPNVSLDTFVNLTTRKPVLRALDDYRAHPSIAYTGSLNGVTAPVEACVFTNEYGGQASAPDGQFAVTGSHTGATPSETRVFAFPYPLAGTSAPIVDQRVSNTGPTVDLGALTPAPTKTATIQWSLLSPRLLRANLLAKDGTRCFIHTSDLPDRLPVPILPDTLVQLEFDERGSGVTLTLSPMDQDLGVVALPRDTKMVSPQPAPYQDGTKPWLPTRPISWDSEGTAARVALHCRNYAAKIYVDGKSATLPDASVHRDLGAPLPSGACTLTVDTTTSLASAADWANLGRGDSLDSSGGDGGYVSLP